MPILWNAETKEIHLHNDRVSYVMRVLENGALGGLHVGAPLATARSYGHLSRMPFHGFSNRLGYPVALEYPTPGTGDSRVPALVAAGADGATNLALEYVEHRIFAGKLELAGLPSTYVEDATEVESIEILLADRPTGLEVRLIYSIFRDRPVVARSARIRNAGGAAIRLETAMSASLDLPDADWTMTQLSGAWARERHVVTRPLYIGRQSIESQRGASSAHQNPFLALARPTTTEESGEAFGFAFVYSGNFLAEVEVDPYATARIRLGINPEGFSWVLEPGAELTVPEALLVYSDHGLSDLSETFHRLFRERMARGTWRDRPRPILLNSWEATYFDFDEPKLLRIAGAARDLGVELFVLDDGWFGERDDDTSSLGDWFVNPRKLPGGLDGLARKVRDLGLDFGLWIEPEMVSPRSRLYAEHPDWAVGIPGRPRTESRSQLVLDMSRPDVVDHLVEQFSGILAGAPISYVKWDMNRTITEPYSAALPADRQGEFFHRHILGVYELWNRLTRAFPDVLFESCASGGGRFDAGMLAYAPQAWTSDDTDPIERLKIQWGTSLAYPISSMGAHVAATPNHQVGRVTPLATRAAVAFFGLLGYELDPTALTETERLEVAAQIAFYAGRRELFQRGRFLRLRSPFAGDGNETAWMTVSDDERRAIVGWYRVLSQPERGPSLLRLRGLDPAAAYRVSVWPVEGDALTRTNALVRGGDDLMRIGLFLDDAPREFAGRGDFQARIFELESV